MRRSSFIILIFFLLNIPEHLCQDKVNLGIGLGLPELINFCGRLQFEQIQASIGVGTIPGRSIYSISGDIYYHFAGTSIYSNRRIWYVKTGITYSRDETDIKIFKYIFLNIRGGIEYNISERFGIDFELGIFYELMRDVIYKELRPSSSNWFGNFDIDIKLGPGLGVIIFYKI